LREAEAVAVEGKPAGEMPEQMPGVESLGQARGVQNEMDHELGVGV